MALKSPKMGVMDHFVTTSAPSAPLNAQDETARLQALVDEALASGECDLDMQAIRAQARERLKRELST